MKRVALLLGLLATPASAVMPGAADDAQVIEGARLLEDGSYELGLPLLRAALARLPNDPDILVYIAFAERRLGNSEGAMAAYRAALAEVPTHAGALAYQGSLFLALGDREGAAANLALLGRSCGGCAEHETLAREIARAR
jgi:tetratricopeptide (TPR) repeat protein